MWAAPDLDVNSAPSGQVDSQEKAMFTPARRTRKSDDDAPSAWKETKARAKKAEEEEELDVVQKVSAKLDEQAPVETSSRPQGEDLAKCLVLETDEHGVLEFEMDGVVMRVHDREAFGRLTAGHEERPKRRSTAEFLRDQRNRKKALREVNALGR